MSLIDPRTTMVVIGFIGVVSQALAAWWWFKASCHEMSGDVQDFTRELREIARLNAPAAIAQTIAATCAVALWLTGHIRGEVSP
jgi:hypothetical protein